MPPAGAPRPAEPAGRREALLGDLGPDRLMETAGAWDRCPIAPMRLCYPHLWGHVKTTGYPMSDGSGQRNPNVGPKA